MVQAIVHMNRRISSWRALRIRDELAKSFPPGCPLKVGIVDIVKSLV